MRNKFFILLLIPFAFQISAENLEALKPSKATLTMNAGDMEVLGSSTFTYVSNVAKDVGNPLAESNAKNRVTELHSILNDVTVNGLDNIPTVTPSWSNFTYDSELCERDTRLNLQGLDGYGGILYDLRYGGNEQTRYTASKYWINSTK